MRQLFISETELEKVVVIKSFCHQDLRGDFYKFFITSEYLEKDICFSPFEEGIVKSSRGVLRGIHFQNSSPQTKLITCIDGNLWTVVVDIDRKRNTFGKWVEVDLIPGTSIIVPNNYAVGTLALVDSCFHSAYDSAFVEEYSDGIRWNDNMLGIPWPKLDKIIVSEKDSQLPLFSNLLR